MNKLQPIRLLPARERVASELRKAILSKELEEGTIITLEDISSQLGISNTPVREAFQILARDGLIRLRPNKGAEVLGINYKFIRDHYETRAILERECAAAICRNGADISVIENFYLQSKESLEAGNSNAYSDYNQAFHMAIWEAAGNEKIRNLLSEMWNGLSMGSKVSEEEYVQISISQHKLIVEAIEKRDEKLAYHQMNAHIVRSMENMLTRFQG